MMNAEVVGFRHSEISASDIRAVIAEPGRIGLVAQPIVDLRRSTVVGYELLARFTLPSDKPSFPGRVFQAAAQSGLGPQLETIVVKKALALAAERPEGAFVSINIDPAHIAARGVVEVFDAYQDLSGVVIELTKLGVIEDLEKMRRALGRLRDKGALIAIADAGAGYAQLKQLVALQPEIVKVDRDLVSGVHKNEANRVLVQMLVELAGRLDAWLLAEGVETESELRALRQLGVPFAQGFFVGRPQAPWSTLDRSALTALKRSGRHQRFDLKAKPRVADVLEACWTGEGVAPPEAKVAIRLDAASRPIAMRVGSRTVWAANLMFVKTEETLGDVALRASKRAEDVRWDPLVCVDLQGHVTGVVTMDKLLTTLASR